MAREDQRHSGDFPSLPSLSDSPTLSTIVTQGNVSLPAVIIVADSRSLHDQSLVHYALEALGTRWAARAITINEEGEPRRLETRNRTPTWVSMAAAERFRVTRSGIIGIGKDGGVIVSPTPATESHLDMMITILEHPAGLPTYFAVRTKELRARAEKLAKGAGFTAQSFTFFDEASCLTCRAKEIAAELAERPTELVFLPRDTPLLGAEDEGMLAAEIIRYDPASNSVHDLLLELSMFPGLFPLRWSSQ